MRRVQIDEFLAGAKAAIVLDVRSPGEYRHAHMPGAISLPLFSDEERKVVGTAYKQQSREAAIKIGLDYFGPKMRGMVEEVERLVSANQPENGNHTPNFELPISRSVFIYCWRGGMRSGAVAWLLNLYGFNVTVLAGGYKTFRNHVLKSFEQAYAFKILGGYTGSGKTELLHQLKQQGQSVVDLEAIASHKGSAFGNINMAPQPSQEMFENVLSIELQKASVESAPTATAKLQTPNAIWLEDESQRIGSVNIPAALWATMRSATVYFLDIPFEERLRHIVEEYGACDKEKLGDAIERIKKRLGGAEAKAATQFLAENKTEACFRILLRYYDKHYLKGLQNRESLSSLLKVIACEKVTVENAAALAQAQTETIHAGTN